MTTRATILSRAFARLAIADYIYATTAEERADARLTLDAMLEEWAESGVDLGHTPSDGTENDAVVMTTPAWADQAIWSNLAVRLAPDFGKTPAPALIKDARRGYDLASGKTQVIPTALLARTSLRGGGDRCRRYLPERDVIVDGDAIVVDG
jgi:hypothetical protein